MHKAIAFTAILLFAMPLAAAPEISLVPVVAGLDTPVAITHAGDLSGRLFVTLQAGRVVIVEEGAVRPEPFLDIRNIVLAGGERGLLSVAFHPAYGSNGRFFVNYTAAGSGDTVIAEYRVSSADPNRADPASRREILRIAQPFSNHNGGQLQFGPDGYLYIGMGDGGSGGDPGDRAQNLSTLLGKMLRIDIDGALPYAIPSDNPFVSTPGARPEIWALGLRNPWRFSFDRVTGELFIADVGQSAREEVNHQPASSGGGENYGWRRMEGTLCFNPSSGCNDGSLTLPILEYGRELGCSITGGYRYRGWVHPSLRGVYFYGDFCSGRIWGAESDGQAWSSEVLLSTARTITTFGEDEAGEVYVTGFDGTLYRIEAESGARRRAVRRAD